MSRSRTSPQIRITVINDNGDSEVEKLETVVSANLRRATRLRHSILQKAFTGSLVVGVREGA